MFRRLFTSGKLTALALLGSALAAGPVAAGGATHGSPPSTSGYGAVYNPAPVYPTVPSSTVSAPVTASSTAATGNSESLLEVTVPADAKVNIEGADTTQTGTMREFVSPPLFPGHEYSYQIKVKWTENGKEMTRTHRVAVHAGDVIHLAFGEEGQK